MSFAFSWKKTFDRVCNVFFPMVMATEVQEVAHDENSSLSIPSKINAKCVGNPFTQIPAERNGVSSRAKLTNWPTSLTNNKHEEQPTATLDMASKNGESCADIESKSSAANNSDNSNNNLKTDVSPSHLRQLLLLHLDLIQQQQQQIQEKDKEIVQLKTDKEQLEARIHRMERRMAVKRQNSDTETDISIPGRAKKLTPLRKPLVTELMRRKVIPAASSVLMSSKIQCNVNIDTCLRTEKLYLENFLDETTDVTNEQPVTSSDHLATTSDVPTPKFRVVEQFAVPVKTAGTTTRSGVSTTTTTNENVENLDDEMFSKRHQRLETDEKKRKRWDIQRYRALKQREELQEKYKQREEARLKGRRVSEHDEEKQLDDSFVPDTSQIQAVEMSDTVPVSAFGAPVQSFQSREFDLPWFSLERRELQEREKLKSKGRGRRRSYRKS